jgi:hypothetical protein
MEAKVCKNLHNWDNQIHCAIWVYNFTFKSSIDFTPFRLTYGVESTLPTKYEVMTFHIAKQHWLVMEELQNKKNWNWWNWRKANCKHDKLLN